MGSAMATGFALWPSLSLASGSSEPVRLHSNENPYGPSQAAREAIVSALSEGNLYPYQSYPDLRHMIAAREGLTPDHVVLGAGSQEILRMTAMAYGMSGGDVVIANPTYEGIADHAATIAARVHKVPLDSGLNTDLDAMDRRTTNSVDLVFICNPNNPSGTISDTPTLEQFCEEVSRRAVILVDEAYFEQVADPGYRSMTSMVGAGSNVIVSRTFSKVYGLAGLRVGYGLARPDIAARLRQFRTGASLNILGIRAAIAAYKDQKFMLECKDRINASRAIITAHLKDSGHRCTDSQANFIFFQLGSSLADFQAGMLKRNIRVGRAFPPYMDWCRLSVGTEEEMEAFQTAFTQFRPSGPPE